MAARRKKRRARRRTALEAINNEGWLTALSVAEKQAQVPRLTWLNEYELQEPSPEARAIDSTVIAWLFGRALGDYDFSEDWVGEVIIEEPEAGAAYGTGIDIAKDVDWTWIFTYRCDWKPAELVAFARWGRLPWPTITEKMEQHVRKFDSMSWHDATGIGKVVTDYLNVHSVPFEFVGKQRTDLLSDYLLALEHHKMRNPMIRLMHAEHRFLTNDMLFGTSHLPDTVAAGALAWAAVKHVRGADVRGARKAYKKARRRMRQAL